MRVILAMPRYKMEVCIASSQAFYHPSHPDSLLEVRAVSPASSLLTACFNSCWALARNEWEGGRADAFAMIHADVAPPIHWMDVLYAEMQKVGADLIAAVIPIKDGRGLTSTVVDDTVDPWSRRRLTMKEVMGLPPTFTDADVGAPLLLNTGLWLCKLGPWCLDVHFRQQDTIRRDAGTGGQWVARSQPEDWDFSEQCRAKGLKLAATRLVPVEHYGEQKWSNRDVWGWSRDLQGGRAANAMYDGWKFPADVDGWLTEEEGVLLAQLARGATVLEIGSYCGRSTICMAQTASCVHAVDTWDGRATPNPKSTRSAFWENLERYGVAGKVQDHAGRSTEIVPNLTRRFGVAFIDGAHDTESVLADARLALTVLESDGVLAFHDSGVAGELGVNEAIRRLLNEGMKAVEQAGSVAVLKPVDATMDAIGP